MNAGNIWQIVIGNYNTFEDLYTSHSSGCDVKSNTRKIIIELKNRYNTDNYSSKKILRNFNHPRGFFAFKKILTFYRCINIFCKFLRNSILSDAYVNLR